MGVYKEGYAIIKDIEEASVSIPEHQRIHSLVEFKDYCVEVGAWVTKGSSIWNGADQLAAWYGDPKTRKVIKSEKFKSIISIDIELIDESDARRGRTNTYRLYYVGIENPIVNVGKEIEALESMGADTSIGYVAIVELNY